MNAAPSHSSPLILCWILFLSIALLQAQAIQYHAHGLDHGIGEASSTPDRDHGHAVSTHLSIDNSHSDHHEGIMYELDVSPDRIVSNGPISLSPVLALILVTLLMVLGTYRSYHPGKRLSAAPLPRRRYHLIPLLRAPPR